jgi:hypothetical protein
MGPGSPFHFNRLLCIPTLSLSLLPTTSKLWTKGRLKGKNRLGFQKELEFEWELEIKKVFLWPWVLLEKGKESFISSSAEYAKFCHVTDRSQIFYT